MLVWDHNGEHHQHGSLESKNLARRPDNKKSAPLRLTRREALNPKPRERYDPTNTTRSEELPQPEAVPG